MSPRTRTCPCKCTRPQRDDATRSWKFVVTTPLGPGDHPALVPAARASSTNTKNDDSPPPYEKTNPSPYEGTKPSPSSPTVEHMRLLARSPTTVSRLPRDRPLPGIEYLSIIDSRGAPVEFDECRGCKIRRHDSCKRTSWSLIVSTAGIMPVQFVYERDSGKFLMQIVPGTARGEVRRYVKGGGNAWTRHFSWGLAVRHQDPAGT